MPMTIAEKILARASGKKEVRPDEIVIADIDIAMSHENGDMVRKSFLEIGVDKVWDPNKIVIIFDHRIPAESEKTATSHKALREFVKAQGIKNFFDVGRGGICHQILPDEGYVWPGAVLVGTDSHTTTHGAFGALATGIGATEMAGVWTEGKLWFKVPRTIKITINGKLNPNVYAKDVILYVIGKISSNGADYSAVEFCGETIDDMTIASRMVLTNLSMEMGAKTAFTPIDEKLKDYLAKRDVKGNPDWTLKADPDAKYAEEIVIDAEKEITEPQIACPHEVDNIKPISKLGRVNVNQGVLGSCTNGRLEDLEVAAKILDGNKIHPDCRLVIVPASQEIYLQALERKYIEIFIRAGAIVNPPGCGPCLGIHQGVIAAGENCVSSTNRNFQGRMGSKDSNLYLASPAVVAASAIKGYLALPDRLKDSNDKEKSYFSDKKLEV
ncbi:MAG: 3-isopropylmalate dehydratase large subunit [Elusimicrobia bacterium]|nr:3-isopropylmalate dehydratase large subunit [Elusimicrobiota bacterium]